MPRGGRRSGRAGKAYSNRSDLRGGPLPVTTAPSAGYGDRVAQERAQQAVPMAAQPSPAVPTPLEIAQRFSSQAPPPTGPVPGELGDFLRPSERPGEPLTAGLVSGPGPGPEALGMSGNPDRDELGAIYARFPSEGLRELLEAMDEDDA